MLQIDSLTNVATHIRSIGDVEEQVSTVAKWLVGAGWNVLGAIAIFVIGRFLISLIMKVLHRTMERRKVDASIQTFLSSFVNITLMILLIVAIIGRLGIDTTSFAALLASAGVAIGMAMSGNLNNLAGGLIILLLRPYKVGDYIETQGLNGTVKAIQIFHTILNTTDNKNVYIPNGALSSGTLTNYSSNKTRRLEWTVGVEYGESSQKVMDTVMRIVADDQRILRDPAPFVALSALDASSVNFIIRVWVKSEDYWDVNFDMNQRIYETFNREGIGFPFPQLTIHQTQPAETTANNTKQ